MSDATGQSRHSNNNYERIGTPANTSAPNSNLSGHQREMYIYDLPPSVNRQLCDHLDELDVWNQLAILMSIRPADLQIINRKTILGNSPSEELLNLWGGQYNHTVSDLFLILKKQKLYQAMCLLKKFVPKNLHMFIPNSRPVLTELLARDSKETNSAQSIKKLNCDSSSGVSNSNNLDTSDNNYSTTSHSSNWDSNKPAPNEFGNVVSQQHPSNLLNSRSINEYASSIPEINYLELTEATNNWSDQFILGRGGFGTVYRGYWKHSDVAIKQIHYRGPNGRESAKVQLQQSLNELKYLNSCRHDNVLPLYGYSIKGEKPCLVYQLMKGGSLEQRLNTKKVPPLTWQQRINICLGTARGINYLHTFREKPLIHGDIKPANVLLDQCLHPKIGDFGLAREGPTAVGPTSAVEVTQVFGTKPYLPPEFLNSKKLSTQVDTYSFGVVLLETFTGMRAYEKNRENPLLTRHILKLYIQTDFKLEDHIDRNVPLQTSLELEICRNSIQLGINCIAEYAQQRPDMESVLKAIYTYYQRCSQFL